MKDDEEKWLFRLGIDDIEEIRRAIDWDKPPRALIRPRCSCGQPLPDIGNHCGAVKCRDKYKAIQLIEIDHQLRDGGDE